MPDPDAPEEPRYALAVDIGGTKIGAALVTADGALLGRTEVPTPRTRDGEEVFAALCSACDAVADSGMLPAGLAPAGIGVATAGPLDTVDGTVSPVNIPAWRGFPLRRRLVDRYRLDVRMFGDAVAVTVAEHWRGAARGLRNVMGMVISTGIGGGLLLGGRVIPGAGGNAGHIGHMSVDPDGPVCACGGIGCVEVLCSGTAIGRWAAEHTADRAQPLTTARDVARAARTGDRVAQQALDRAAGFLGMAIAGAVTLLDLELVVIGGGVSPALDLLRPALESSYRRYAALGYASAPRIVDAELSTGAGLLGAGAAVLFPDEYWPAR